MHPLPATWSAVNLCQINGVASQLENPALKRKRNAQMRYKEAAFGGRWLAGAIPFPAPRTGSLAVPRTPAVPRRGWAFLPMCCNLWFSLLGHIPRSTRSYLRKPKSTGLRRRLAPQPLCRQAEPEGWSPGPSTQPSFQHLPLTQRLTYPTFLPPSLSPSVSAPHSPRNERPSTRRLIKSPVPPPLPLPSHPEQCCQKGGGKKRKIKGERRLGLGESNLELI